MTEQPLKGIKVAFLHPRLEGGGSERVSLTTAKRFAQWGIHTTFIATQHFAQEFSISEDLDASIYILPKTGGFANSENKQELIDYIRREQNTDCVYLLYRE